MAPPDERKDRVARMDCCRALNMHAEKDVLHSFSHDLASVRRTRHDPFFAQWAMTGCIFSFPVVVKADSAVAHFCRVHETMQDDCAAASWLKS